MSDPNAHARVLIERGEALLVEVRQARIALAAAAESAERAMALVMLESFERGLLAALQDVVGELKTLRGDPEAAAWLRRSPEGLGGGSVESPRRLRVGGPKGS